jgi:putative endonuclease
MNLYWVYILASQPRGTLYIGVTNNILGRVELHRSGKGPSFTSRYRVSMLVYFEEFGHINEAIQREKTLKHYVRSWKVNLSDQTRSGSISTPACCLGTDNRLGASRGLDPRDKPEDDRWRAGRKRVVDSFVARG